MVEFPFWGSPGFAVYSLDGKVSPCRAAWVWTVSACVCSCVEVLLLRPFSDVCCRKSTCADVLRQGQI